MENNNDMFGGFSAITDVLGSNPDIDDNVSRIDDDFINRSKYDDSDEDEDEDLNEEEEEDQNDGKNDDIDDEEDDDDDDLTEEEKAAIKNAKKNAKRSKSKSDKKSTDQNSGDDDEGLGEAEAEIAEFVQEKLYDSFGIEVTDEEADKFKSIDDIIGFIKEAIDYGSTPEFASEEVANIDKYVRDGGNLQTYMSEVYGEVDLDNVDITKESVQKQLVKQALQVQGLSESRIEKRLERFEDMGVLEEEAEDARDYLKEVKESQAQTLLDQQEKAKKKALKEQQDFITSVETELEAMDNILGIPISKAEKNKLFNYMLKPTSNGVPQYHIDYRDSRRNMIESAYFTMNKGKLLKKVETKAKSTATKKLKEKLADKGTRGINQVHSTFGGNSLSRFAKALS